MQHNSNLTLLEYRVNELEYKFNKDFDFRELQKVQMNNDFSRNIEKIDDNTVAVRLKVDVHSEDEKLSPFSIKAEIEGIFLLNEWEKPALLPLIHNNTIAILFPFLRALVSTITANANIPPYNLPIINILALFNDEKAKKKE